ncbi:unnamed protein product [Symbiodinium natans]|uniref:Crossover junction endonuclease MUS81 n=1 Tax=Symbiodinium natans TaxID=878477 RepID=A0A812QE76_9DINO|nr:unnamed protein product [Symbiodinium natans]
MPAILLRSAARRCGSTATLLGRRRLSSQSFQISKKNGECIQFTSTLTDTDVLLALGAASSAFAQHLRDAGTQGKWSRKMRSWAHYLALQQRSGEGTPREEPSREVPEIDPHQPVVVRVDSREKKLIEILRESSSLTFSVETLRVGDIIIGTWPYEIYIERKAIPDLVQSVYDTRLHNQLGNKLYHTDYERFRAVVVLEGRFERLSQAPQQHQDMDADAAQRLYQRKRRLAVATMVRLCVRDQISVLRAYDMAGTAEIIGVLAEEYPKLVQWSPLQYSQRKDKPFRPRRGEEPKDALVSQLRCIRGVSQESARHVAGRHPTMKSFLEALSAEKDPVQWLMSNGTFEKISMVFWFRDQFSSPRLRSRPTAALLVEALMGEEALQQENFLNTLKAGDDDASVEVKGLKGVSAAVAAALAQHFGTAHAMQEALKGAADPAAVLEAAIPVKQGPRLVQKRPRRRLPPSGRAALEEAFGGEASREARALRARLRAVKGIGPTAANRLVESFPSEAALAKALLSSPVAADPAGRAMALAPIRSRPAAMRLVAAFLDGRALEESSLIDALRRSGIASGRAAELVASVKGRSRRAKLRKKLEKEQTEAGGSLGLTPSEVKKALRRLECLEEESAIKPAIPGFGRGFGRVGAEGAPRLTFPPLQPKFAQLLHALLVRFDLAFTVQGWGDERRVTVEATRSRGLLPALRCEHFLSAAGLTQCPRRLADVGACEVEAASFSEPTRRAEDEEPFVPEHDDREKAAPTTPVKRKRDQQGYGGGGGGMRGWSSEEESDEKPAPASKADARRAPKAANHRVTRGRGFLSESEQAAAAPPSDEDAPIRCRLRGDYEHYAIDPEDTWRPHRKPYVELLSEAWEFSHAWSFEPEHNPNRPAPPKGDPGGVATFRVEHASERSFSVAVGGQSQDMRRWLSGRSGAGEEPYVLELRVVEEERRWDFRFGRVSKLGSATWRPLLWSCERHTIFWLACFVGREDGKNYLQAGLDIFPEKRFFSARLASFPKMLGFGVPAGSPGPFFVRDVVLFGRGALRAAPFAGRDHFVEVPLTRRQAEAALRKEKLAVEVFALSGEDEEEKETREDLGRTPWRKMFSDGILDAPAPAEAKEPSKALCLVACESSENPRILAHSSAQLPSSPVPKMPSSPARGDCRKKGEGAGHLGVKSAVTLPARRLAVANEPSSRSRRKFGNQVVPGLLKVWPPPDAGAAADGVEALDGLQGVGGFRVSGRLFFRSIPRILDKGAFCCGHRRIEALGVAAKQFLDSQEKAPEPRFELARFIGFGALQALSAETVREVGLFKELYTLWYFTEHLIRTTRHLEGSRIARSAAMPPWLERFEYEELRRMILSGVLVFADTAAQLLAPRSRASLADADRAVFCRTQMVQPQPCQSNENPRCIARKMLGKCTDARRVNMSYSVYAYTWNPPTLSKQPNAFSKHLRGLSSRPGSYNLTRLEGSKTLLARSRSARHPPHATPPAARAAAVRVEAAGPGRWLRSGHKLRQLRALEAADVFRETRRREGQRPQHVGKCRVHLPCRGGVFLGGGLHPVRCDDTGCSIEVQDTDRGFLGGGERAQLWEDPSAEFASTESAEVSRFLLRPADFAYSVTEVRVLQSLGHLLKLFPPRLSRMVSRYADTPQTTKLSTTGEAESHHLLAAFVNGL